MKMATTAKPTDPKTHLIPIEVEITEERMSDLLCTALEGGSNYWYQAMGYVNPNNVKTEYKHLELPFIEGCGMMIGDCESDEEPKLLNLEAMLNGLKIMGVKYPWHLKNFLEENDDAETGDVFLQCSLFGEIVYG